MAEVTPDVPLARYYHTPPCPVCDHLLPIVGKRGILHTGWSGRYVHLGHTDDEYEAALEALRSEREDDS